MSLKKIVKYRDIWMCAAIVWTIFFHGNFQVTKESLSIIKWIGYGGVDLFIFASGIGCYYSLEKDDDVFNFIKRRIVRIIPTYWIFMIGWGLYKRSFSQMAFRTFLGNFLCVRNFTGLGEDFSWYISAMWLTYLLAPFFKGLLDRINSIYMVVIFTLFLGVLSVCFWDSYTFIITMSRLPLFFIGMYIGKLAWNDVYISKLSLLWLWIFMELGVRLFLYWSGVHAEMMWLRGYYWYPFILITPGLCMLISCLMELIKKIFGKVGEYVEKVLAIPGKFSFELFLLHVWFFDILNNNWIPSGKVPNEEKTWIVSVLLLIPACLILRGLTKSVILVIGKCCEMKEKVAVRNTQC